ncbi:hypothetical protein Dimus_033969 [Dionaea muscipula]
MEGHEIPNHVHEMEEPKLNGSRKLTKNPSLTTLVSVLWMKQHRRRREDDGRLRFKTAAACCCSSPPRSCSAQAAGMMCFPLPVIGVGMEGHEIPNHVHEMEEPKLNGSRKLTKNASLETLVSVLWMKQHRRRREDDGMLRFKTAAACCCSSPPRSCSVQAARMMCFPLPVIGVGRSWVGGEVSRLGQAVMVMVKCGGRVSTVNGVGEQAVMEGDGWPASAALGGDGFDFG